MNFRPFAKAPQDFMALFIILQSLSSLLSELYNCYSELLLSDFTLTVYSLLVCFTSFISLQRFIACSIFFMCFKDIRNCFLKQYIMVSLEHIFPDNSVKYLPWFETYWFFSFSFKGNCPSLESYGYFIWFSSII